MSAAENYDDLPVTPKRLHQLLGRFVDLDPANPNFTKEFGLLRMSAKTALERSNRGMSNPENLSIARAYSAARRRQNALNRQVMYKPYIDKLRAEGRNSLRQLAEGMNELKVPPPTGADKWTFMMVRSLIRDYKE